jgi:uncharacterized membrane protein YjgN (DUF898 family)
VSWPQIVVGALLVVTLVGLSGFFLGRQMQTLRDLRRNPAATEEEERRLRRQTYRRLVCSSLLLLLGFLLAAALLFLEAPAQELADKQAGLQTEAEIAFGRLYAGFWIGFLLILMAIVFIVAFDMWATRRHSLLEQRKIQADRRAMLEQQINRLRHERNG